MNVVNYIYSYIQSISFEIIKDKISDLFTTYIGDVENFLSIVGLLSIVLTLIRFFWNFSKKHEWIDDFKLKEYSSNVDIFSEVGLEPVYYPLDFGKKLGDGVSQNLFIPNNTIIRKVKIKKVQILKPDGSKTKYKTVYTVDEINPYSPLCLVIERTQSIPTYMIEWKTVYGGKCQYYFGDMPTGNDIPSGFRYEFGFWANVRRILDLK